MDWAWIEVNAAHVVVHISGRVLSSFRARASERGQIVMIKKPGFDRHNHNPLTHKHPITDTSQQASKHGGTFGHGPAAVGVLGSQAVHELPGPGKLLRGAIGRKCAVPFDNLLCPDQSDQSIPSLEEYYFPLQSTSAVTEPVGHA